MPSDVTRRVDPWEYISSRQGRRTFPSRNQSQISLGSDYGPQPQLTSSTSLHANNNNNNDGLPAKRRPRGPGKDFAMHIEKHGFPSQRPSASAAASHQAAVARHADTRREKNEAKICRDYQYNVGSLRTHKKVAGLGFAPTEAINLFQYADAGSFTSISPAAYNHRDARINSPASARRRIGMLARDENQAYEEDVQVSVHRSEATSSSGTVPMPEVARGTGRFDAWVKHKPQSVISHHTVGTQQEIRHDDHYNDSRQHMTMDRIGQGIITETLRDGGDGDDADLEDQAKRVALVQELLQREVSKLEALMSNQQTLPPESNDEPYEAGVRVVDENRDLRRAFVEPQYAYFSRHLPAHLSDAQAEALDENNEDEDLEDDIHRVYQPWEREYKASVRVPPRQGAFKDQPLELPVASLIEDHHHHDQLSPPVGSIAQAQQLCRRLAQWCSPPRRDPMPMGSADTDRWTDVVAPAREEAMHYKDYASPVKHSPHRSPPASSSTAAAAAASVPWYRAERYNRNGAYLAMTPPHGRTPQQDLSLQSFSDVEHYSNAARSPQTPRATAACATTTNSSQRQQQQQQQPRWTAGSGAGLTLRELAELDGCLT